MVVKRAGAPVRALPALGGAAVAAAVPAFRAAEGALPVWWLPVPWVVAVLGAPLVLADLRHRRLPDALTWPAYPAVAVALGLAAVGGGGPHLLAGALAGCLLFGGAHLFVHRRSAGGLGAGDVKLSGALGAVLGALGGTAPLVAAVLAAMVSLTALTTAWLRQRHGPPPKSTETPSPGWSAPDPAHPLTALPAPDQLPEGDLPRTRPGPGLPDASCSPPALPVPDQLPEGDSPRTRPAPEQPSEGDPPRIPPAPDRPDPGHPSRACPGRRRPHRRRLRLASSGSGGRQPDCLARGSPVPGRLSRPVRLSRGSPRWLRAGPGRLVVPHGPGLVLATWACAVFPAVGTGVT
ncbi:prepilin peptidase [Amycolatopsis ultiminotia]